MVRIQLTAPSACLAVIAESYYPFWHAEIDGQPAEVLRVSCGLMGVEVPAGSHTILLRYQPPRVYAMAEWSAWPSCWDSAWLFAIGGQAASCLSALPPINRLAEAVFEVVPGFPAGAFAQFGCRQEGAWFGRRVWGTRRV